MIGQTFDVRAPVRVQFAVLPKLLLLFILVPLVELTLLLVLGDFTRWWIPVLTVLVSGVVGATLARSQGLQTLRRIQDELSQGHLPTDSLLDALLILLAGALLITPGLLTDLLGVSLLIPPCRKFYRARLVAWFTRHFQLQTFASHGEPPPSRSTIIDSYVVGRSETTDHRASPPNPPRN